MAPLEPTLRVAPAEPTPPADGDQQQQGVQDSDEAGYRTPIRAKRAVVAPGDASCPPAPRKPTPPPAVIAQRTQVFYAGGDLEAFFAAQDALRRGG